MKEFKYREKPPETKYIDRILLMGGDVTNVFVSILCNPLFLPTGPGDIGFDVVKARFYCEGRLPQVLMNMAPFLPEYCIEYYQDGSVSECKIMTSIFTYDEDDEEDQYLPFNLVLYALRGILQVLCLMTIVVSIAVSGISLNDEFWIYFTFGTILVCVVAQLALLFGIEYAFQEPCGSTFNTEVAILTDNARMAKELLWLNKSPSVKVGNETLVSIAARDRKASFPLPLLKLILDNDFDANQRVGIGRTIVMIFLESDNEECVRHLWKAQSLDVNAIDDFGCGLAHFAITNNLEFLKFMMNTMNVPFHVKDNLNHAVLFGAIWNEGRRNEISEDVLDWLIDEVGSPEDYKSDNILTRYLIYSDIIQLNRIKYWIEKRGINPYDTATCDYIAINIGEKRKTAFDYIAEKDAEGKITAEIRDYFQSLQHSIEIK